MPLRPFAIAVLVLAFGTNAQADVNLVEKREACHLEARQRIKAKGRVSADVTTALLPKRQHHIRACRAGTAPTAPARK